MLDAGCGDGVQSHVFLSYFHRCKIIAIDVRKSNIIEAIRYNKQFHGRFQALIADYHNLPFLNDSFDLVILGFSLHESENKVTVLKEAHRVLKPRGIILIIDYQLAAPTYWISPGKKISPHELLQVVKQHLPKTTARIVHSTKRIHITKVTKHATKDLK